MTVYLENYFIGGWKPIFGLDVIVSQLNTRLNSCLFVEQVRGRAHDIVCMWDRVGVAPCVRGWRGQKSMNQFVKGALKMPSINAIDSNRRFVVG